VRFASAIIPAIAIVLCMNRLAYGGAWTQDAGKGQIIISQSYYQTTKFRDNSGRKQSQAKYQKHEFNPYLEYGLYDGVTVGANLFLQHASQLPGGTNLEPNNYNYGIGDSEFFIRTRLWQQDGFVLSAEPMVKLHSPFSFDKQPAIGSNHPDTGVTFSAGYGFSAYGLNHFANIDLGYRYRFGKEKDQIKFAASLGVSVHEQLMIMPQIFVTRRTDSGNSGAAYVESSSNDYNLTKLQLSAIYKMDEQTSWQLGGFYHAHARNTGTGNGLMLAWWRRF
jgi:hypothetical protein